MKIGLSSKVLALLAASLAGCTTTPYCESIDKCGGDFMAGAKDLGAGVPAAAWSSTAVDACIDHVPNPPNPLSLTLIPPRPAGIRAVEPSTVDWCNGLVLSGDGTIKDFDDGWYQTLKQFNGWFPSVPLYTADLVFQQNYQYSLSTTQLVSQHTDFSNTCLVAQGVVLSCERVGEQLQAFVDKRLNSIAGVKVVVYTGDTNADGTPDNPCLTTTDGGCSCDYNVSLTSKSEGPWAAADGKISFFDFDAAPPAQADYCVSAAGLSLSGKDGSDLFNRNALKTLQLRPK